jgi:hypothetical protein
MKKYILAACAAFIAFTPASAAKFSMSLQPSVQQSSRMQNGIAAVDDSTSGSSVRLIQPEGDLKKRGTLRVLLMNQSAKAFDFGSENVSGHLADGTPIAIIPYEQLAREERSRERWRAFGAALASMNSGRYSATANYNGSSFGSIGSTSYSGFSSGTATVSGYDPTAAAIENRRIFDNVASANAVSREALQANIRTTTVDPQQTFGGSVTFELPKSVQQAASDVPATFVVTISGEQHIFNVLLRRH